MSRPWLIAELGAPLRVISWSLNLPGLRTADKVVWREVRNADLPQKLDAEAWFRRELEDAGHGDAIGLITSRDVGRYMSAHSEQEGIRADAVATVGFTNAERVGQRRFIPPPPVGTINTVVRVSAPLSDAALIEALSIVAEARTAAVMTQGPDLPGIGRATGTGTDCIVIAAPAGSQAHAGLHTATGHAIGAAVLDAVGQGARDWMTEQSV